MRTHLLATAAMAAVLTFGAGAAQAGWDFKGKKPDPKVTTTITEDHDFGNDVDSYWDFDVEFSANLNFDEVFELPEIDDLVNVSLVQKQFGDVTATLDLDINAAESNGVPTVERDDTTVRIPGGTYEVKGDHDYDNYVKVPDQYVKVPTYTVVTAGGTLPVVLGAATAVGNMGSISLDSGSQTTGLLLNSDQIVADAGGGNVDISADATAYVDGAAVKLDATAVANMLSVNAIDPGLISGSIMQTSYGDVTASASLDQDITKSYSYDTYAGLDPDNIADGVKVNPATMTGVIASVSATAVGNMVTINTGSYASIPTGAGTSFNP